MMVDAEDLVIRKEIHVNVPVERAFEVFTAGSAGLVADGDTFAWRRA